MTRPTLRVTNVRNYSHQMLECLALGRAKARSIFVVRLNTSSKKHPPVFSHKSSMHPRKPRTKAQPPRSLLLGLTHSACRIALHWLFWGLGCSSGRKETDSCSVPSLSMSLQPYLHSLLHTPESACKLRALGFGVCTWLGSHMYLPTSLDLCYRTQKDG